MAAGRAEGGVSIAVGITGASGAIYATRTLAALLERSVHVELIVSDYGRRLLRDELGDAASVDRLMPYLAERYGLGVAAGSLTVHNNGVEGAALGGGSHGCRGMAIVPCSMKTLAAVAHGLSRSLIERAADVMMKEQRRLVIVPRETPMSLPQLRNMVLCAEAGAMILPAMPAFYQQPKSLDDLADFMAGKIPSAVGFEHELYPAWAGEGRPPRLGSQRLHRMDRRRFPGRQIARDQRCDEQHRRAAYERQWIARRETEQERGDAFRQYERSDHAGGDARGGHAQRGAQDVQEHGSPRRAKGELDANLPAAARDRVGHHAVQPDRRQHERQGAERGRQSRQ